MKTSVFTLIESYMLECMSDSAHDKDHIYRVLYVALDIARYEADVDFADKVASCIRTHRFRSENPPIGIEEQILFDSDKVDVTGTIGIARTISFDQGFAIFN